MKTTKISSLISLVLAFAFAASSFAGNIGKKDGVTSNTSIRYTVNVVFGQEKPVSGTYMIRIMNECNRLVAPPQILVPGQAQYVFFERGPADGIRIAVLTKAPGHGGIEPWVTLYAEPAIVKGPFEVGKTYRFDLYPKLLKERE